MVSLGHGAKWAHLDPLGAPGARPEHQEFVLLPLNRIAPPWHAVEQVGHQAPDADHVGFLVDAQQREHFAGLRPTTAH